MDSKIVGETAAVVTSCLVTIGPLFYFSAGRRIGSLSVNAYRIIMAVGFLVLAHAILLGTILPVATNEQWFWTGMSGVVNFGVGDFAFFAALVMLGPRRLVLVTALSPIFASVGAYLMLGETIPALGIVGVAITLIGIAVVVLEEEERSGEEPISKKQRGQGVFLALIAAIGSGVGLVLAKKGIYSDPEMTLNPLSASLMRTILAALFVWAVVLVAGKLPELRKGIKNKIGIGQTAAGAFTGNFVGVIFSMVAVTYTSTGIAQTLMSLPPVLMIPMTWILYKQRTSFRGILGAAMAVIGVSILFLT